MNNFFSQTSLKDYLFCPYKYKLKYIDKIYWFHLESSSLKNGADFHLAAERYFSKIPNLYNFYINDWLKNLKQDFPITQDEIYLPEYNLNYSEHNIKLKARYDLIVLKKNKIQIIDFKTNSKNLNFKDQKEDIQTKVYLFVLANSLSLFKNKNYSLNDINMAYWQPNFEKISIPYSFEKHIEYSAFFKNLINEIQNSKFKKNNSCKSCEFKFFCQK
jgi:CRISPR/Cas system-associated exonuclease Cas4 (RecB family)